MKRRTPGDPKVAIGYVRVSTEDQDLGGPAQRAAVERWAASRGITIASWHEDHGISGGKGIEARPGLFGALAALREHNAGLLIAAKRCRFARDIMVAAFIGQAAEKAGATVVTADGASDAEGAIGDVMKGMIDLFNAYLRAQIRNNTKAALAVKKSRGERTGSVPFGFRLAADGAHRMLKGGVKACATDCRGCVHLEPLPAEQAIVAEVRALRASRTLRGVVAECGARGLVSRSGRPLGLTQVARLAA